MLLELKMRIVRKFGFQYLAAQALGIRDDQLSSFLRGRKALKKEKILKLYELLQLTKNEITDLQNELTQIFNEVQNDQ